MAVQVSTTPVNYDQDRRGWVMVAAMFGCAFVIMGNLKALGVLLIPITNDLDSELWLVGWIAVWSNAAQNCCGPVVGALCYLLGSRPVMLSGALLLTSGFILASMSTSVSFLAIFVVVFSGFGSSCAWFTCYSVMASYFREKYHIAVGVSLMGVPIGMMVYGPLTQLLLDTYGWRGTTLLLGGFSFHLLPFAMLVQRDPSSSSAPNTEHYQEIPVSSEDDESKEPRGERVGSERLTDTPDGGRSTNSGSGVKKWCQRFGAAFDFTMLTNVRFMLQTGAFFATSFTYTGYVVFMVSQGQISGLSATQASYLPIALGIGNIIGRGLSPFLYAVGIVPSMTFWACFGSAVMCVSMIATVFIRPFLGQFAITISNGIVMSVQKQAIDVMLRFLTTDDQLANAMGLQGMFIGPAGMLGGLTAGWIYERTGSFNVAFFVFGGLAFVCVPLFIADAVYAKRKFHR